MKIIKIAIIILAVLATTVGIAIFYFFFCLQCVPTGELIGQFNSQNQEYAINIYRSNGGATVDFAIRGEAQDNKKNKKIKTIYWGYNQYEAEVTWIDDKTVVINGHKLNIFTDTYDWRVE